MIIIVERNKVKEGLTGTSFYSKAIFDKIFIVKTTTQILQGAIFWYDLHLFGTIW